MNRLEVMQKATAVAEAIYNDFLQQVVINKVLTDRKGQLSEEAKKRLAKNTHINHLPIRLMMISGKGGWHEDIEKQKNYAKNINITLLDHLLSVTRGSLMLAALDWLNQNPEMEIAYLKKKLTVIAAIAFLHDADKDLYVELNNAAKQREQSLKTSRDIELAPEHIEILIHRYGLADFLAGVEVNLTTAQLLYLVEKVEATQSHRHPPVTLPPRDFEKLSLYIRLADKLDGTWVASDTIKKDGSIQKGGLEGVLQRLAKDGSFLDEKSQLRHDWNKIDVFDPHHPFLLDELQRWLAFFSRRFTGILPLLETHQDGRLFMLLPQTQFDEIVKRAIDALCHRLPFKLELVISTRGVPALYNGQPSHDELTRFINDLPHRDLSQLLRIKSNYQATLLERLDELLSVIDLQPRFPRKSSGQLVTLYSHFDNLNEDKLRRAAHALLLMSLNLDTKPKDNIPNYKQRESILVAAVGQSRPNWIELIEDDYSRRVVTALWSVNLATQQDEIFETIWGEAGLLQQWLEGTDEQAGFNRFITGQGSEVIAAVKRHFEQLLLGQRIFPDNEQAKGRCLFTDEPVDFNASIDEALGLYEVKVSAFSGRDNRPESLLSDKAHTNVSLVAIAEHKLRAAAHEIQGGKRDGVPTLISSPTTVGLFGGLVITDEKAMQAMSLYDLSRLEIKKGKVFLGMEMYQARYRMARFESMPTKLTDQVNHLRLMLQASLRMGRPLHLFRGLPTRQRAFFYYDAMPRVLTELIKDLTDDHSGNALRLEQIPHARQQLEIAQLLLETNGLGYDVLRLYANPTTQFGATCLAWCHLQDQTASLPGEKLLNCLYHNYLDYQEGKKSMNPKDAPLVKLGQAAAGIQKYIGISGSTSKQLLVFDICLNTVNNARSLNQLDQKSLIYAVTGELERELTRKGDAAAKENRGDKKLVDACLEVAELFVNQVWLTVLKGHAPTQRNRRILGSIYRIAFLQTHSELAKQKKSSADNTKAVA
jgi:hypothetical protein